MPYRWLWRSWASLLTGAIRLGAPGRAHTDFTYCYGSCGCGREERGSLATPSTCSRISPHLCSLGAADWANCAACGSATRACRSRHNAAGLGARCERPQQQASPAEAVLTPVSLPVQSCIPFLHQQAKLHAHATPCASLPSLQLLCELGSINLAFHAPMPLLPTSSVGLLAFPVPPPPCQAVATAARGREFTFLFAPGSQR